ncbi:MAG: lysine biosynthesis protein LysW [Acidobacteria bacterium]|nr:lysine biosynthesis protein LysW [Acidobacteriota bacterium]
MNTGICPDCDAEVEVSSDTEIGEFVTCDDCGARLEVTDTDPLELEVVPEEEEEEEEEEDEW